MSDLPPKTQEALTNITSYILNKGLNFVGGIITDDDGNEFVLTVCKKTPESIKSGCKALRELGDS